MKTEDAKRILEGCRTKANEIGKPVTVAIVDGSGALVVLERLNDAAPMTAVIAEGKAAASAFSGRESGALSDMAMNRPTVFNAITQRMQGQRFAPHQGAVPLMNAGGIAGAVGVSGATADEDESIAKAGAAVFSG